MSHSESARLARHPKGNGQQFRTSSFPPCFQETEVRPRSPIFDTPFWSAFSYPCPNSTEAGKHYPCRQSGIAPHASGALPIFSSPISIGQLQSLNTHCTPDNPNPLSKASNRNQSFHSPVVASLILHSGVISFFPSNLYGGRWSMPCRRIFPASHTSDAWKIPASPSNRPAIKPTHSVRALPPIIVSLARRSRIILRISQDKPVQSLRWTDSKPCRRILIAPHTSGALSFLPDSHFYR